MKHLWIAALAVTFGLAAGVSTAQAYKPKEQYFGPEGEPAYDGPVKSKRKKARGAPYRGGDGYRFVYAESWYGFKKVVAPVRRASLGEQVRLPGGTWVYCEASCEYTLRKQSLDFWQSVGRDASVSPGYFRKEFYLDDIGRRRY